MTEGNRMYKLAKEMFPICRSITGQGVRETLEILKNSIGGGTNLSIVDVPSGTEVFDWTVPKEWAIREAYIEDEYGNKIIDMQDNNLHVMGYSTPVDRWVDLEDLKKYIYVEDAQPEVIPYVTSYYKERYGFCMSKIQRDSLKPGKYHMYIDSELFDGNLTYAELILPGESEKEIFFSTYDCHPSMANNECSGPALMTELIKYVKSLEHRRYTYRFIVIPETIGSITYLATKNHLSEMKKNVIAGFNLSCVGDDGDYSFIATRNGHTLADRIMRNVLKYHTNSNYKEYSFLKRGSDERQYNAPGVDLPVVCFCRTLFGEFPEYHTSADNMDFVSPEGFQGAYDVMKQVIDALEHNECYKVKVLCEPQLGKRGLYPTISQKSSFGYDEVKVLTDFLAYADGESDLVDISEVIDAPVGEIVRQVGKLLENDLITADNK